MIDKQIEMHELAKQMSEAISTAVEQRYIEDEAKLEAVLRANGYRKASDVAREIFEELEKLMLDGAIGGKYAAKVINPDKYAELKKKYESEGDK